MSMSKFMAQADPSPSILIDPRESARLLAISPRTLWTLTNRGEIPSLKIGKLVRYRREDLERWAAGRAMVGSGTRTEVGNGQRI